MRLLPPASARLTLGFLLGIMVPGLLLGWLSLRSTQDERLLLEKSFENQYESFVEAFERKLDQDRDVLISGIRARLQGNATGSGATSAFLLGTSLLENPLIHSLVVFQGEEPVFPPVPDQDAAGAGEIPLPPATRALAEMARGDWREGRNPGALVALEFLLHGPDSLPAHGATAYLRFGFRLLHLKALVRQRQAALAAETGRRLLADVLAPRALEDAGQVRFFLSEIVSQVTSLEELPVRERDFFFELHQRLDAFSLNAQRVEAAWPGEPAELLRFHAVQDTAAWTVRILDGVPTLSLGFPWVSRDWRVLARLDPTALAEGLRNEFLADRPSAFRGIEFSLVNEVGEEILATDPVPGREVGLERVLKGDFPAWRLVVYKKRESELAELGRRRALRQYALLAVGLLALLFGTLAVLAGLSKERRMVRMKTNFLSAVSHELKTPLTSIRMFSEMLASGRPIPEAKRQNYAQLIGREALRLHGMIEGILSTTRLEDEGRGLRFAPLTLAEVVQEVTQIMEGSFAKAQVRLQIRTEGDTRLEGDADALRSVVQNLLENSLKYSGQGTRVAVEILGSGHEVTLRVSDQGIGIAPGDLKHIFERFYRAGDEMTRKARGSGLGLSLVKQICDAHRAVVDVKSKVGEGTVMTIVFPRKGGEHAPHSGG